MINSYINITATNDNRKSRFTLKLHHFDVKVAPNTNLAQLRNFETAINRHLQKLHFSA